MGKAVLIIDMPEKCEDCQCSFERDYETICVITGRRDVLNEKPPWCPLKELPYRKRMIGIDGVSGRDEIELHGRQKGWNDYMSDKSTNKSIDTSTNQQEDELKPCPFCGGKAVVREYDNTIDWSKIYRVECQCCQATSKLVAPEERAINLWNYRNPTEQIVKQLEEDKKHYQDEWNTYGNEDDFGGMCAIDRAIEIVKKGGIE